MDTNAARKGARAGRATRRRLLLLCASALAVLALSGCGGGDEPQDADAPTGSWTVKIVKWSFPERQPLGRPVNFELTIRNTDQRDIPSVILTIAGMKQFVEQGKAATNTRPVWLPNDINYADVTPYNSALAQSFNLGPLQAGRFKRYVLPLTPLRRGEHRIGYSLAASLYGGAEIVKDDGNPAADTRIVAIDPTPDFDRSVFD